MKIIEIGMRVIYRVASRFRGLLVRWFVLKAGGGFSIGTAHYIRGGDCIQIGGCCQIMSRARIEAVKRYGGQRFTPKVRIGEHAVINNDFHLGAINSIEIGNHVLIASRVYISDHSHGDIDYASLLIPPSMRELTSKGSVIIEDHVWLGEGVVVLPNVRIGHHSIIGANAVVTKDIPPFSIAAGVPARVIRRIEASEVFA